MGTAMMGTGEATGEQRAITAAREAIFNPLLDDVTLRGAKSLLLSISGGSDLTLFEVHDAVDCVRQELDADANIIFGATLDNNLAGRIRVSIVASGMARVQEERGPDRSSNRQGREPDFRQRLSQAIGTAPEGPEHYDAPHASRPSMPAVEDFPPQAQREYWAKTDPRARQMPEQPHYDPDPPRRPGLLQRLTGLGRERQADQMQNDQLRRQSDRSGRAHPNEQSDGPAFFARGPRK
jgi:cell division protein FtsZ